MATTTTKTAGFYEHKSGEVLYLAPTGRALLVEALDVGFEPFAELDSLPKGFEPASYSSATWQPSDAQQEAIEAFLRREGYVACAYCGELVQARDPKGMSEDDWTAEVSGHSARCEWVATRAHTREVR